MSDFEDLMGRFPGVDWSEVCDGKDGSCTHEDMRIYVLLNDSVAGEQTGGGLFTLTGMFEDCGFLDVIDRALLISIHPDQYCDWTDAVMRFQREWQDADISPQQALREAFNKQENDVWTSN